ncbi:hypothetical protein PEL8287_03831 [Roseovarius litorisediminis]|uniref:Uncharacterized protein n=1 Tax=Roseovarius litorisediminis TaxID=1312363 RepID=A0A1Y5TP68_9RHOB|nr:hypothetical protein [Roseovarius litorisediminis]SLN68734.1 hypothetical protein PEL8287_03831 [Roseovarius litorisediminis]
MGLKKYAEKLDDYFERLKQGKAEKIEATHVEKVIRKLNAKKQQLLDEIQTTTKESKKARLEQKLLFAAEHIKRAEMLLEQISK